MLGQAEALLSQQKQADRLRKQDVQEGQMISGHYIPPSVLGEIANMRNQYIANKREQEALQSGKSAAAAQQKQNETLFGALRRSRAPAAPEAYDY